MIKKIIGFKPNNFVIEPLKRPSLPPFINQEISLTIAKPRRLFLIFFSKKSLNKFLSILVVSKLCLISGISQFKPMQKSLYCITLIFGKFFSITFQVSIQLDKQRLIGKT